MHSVKALKRLNKKKNGRVNKAEVINNKSLESKGTLLLVGKPEGQHNIMELCQAVLWVEWRLLNEPIRCLLLLLLLLLALFASLRR